MGEVYRAHDSRLGRDVAIKVLPEAVSQDPDRMARFDREARLLILELVPGETLAERVARGRVPIDARTSGRSGASSISCSPAARRFRRRRFLTRWRRF